MMFKTRIMFLVLIVILGLCFTSFVMADNFPTFSKGTTISVIFEDVPPLRALTANVKSFEEATGIKVNVEFANYDGVYEKEGLDLGSRTGKYDAMYVDSAWIGKYGPMLRSLDPYMKNATFPKVDTNGFYALEYNAYKYKGHQVGFPVDSTTEVLLYRKDIFEKYNLKVPTTWEEYRTTARWIAKNIPGMYGNGMMAKQHDSLSCDFLPIMWSYGGKIFKNWDHGPVTFNSPATVEAFKFYKSLMDSAPQGVTGWTWDESINAMAQGKTAMTILFHDIGVYFDDPSISKVPGLIEYAVIPGGPAGRYAVYGGSCMAIPATISKKQADAAYLFITWATGYDAQKATITGDIKGGTPPRRDLIESPEVQKQINAPGGSLRFFKPIPETFDKYLGVRPQVAAWPQINTIIYTKLSEYLAGSKTAEQAVKEADQMIRNAVK